MAFLSVKAALNSESLLVHFDPAKPLTISLQSIICGSGSSLVPSYERWLRATNSIRLTNALSSGKELLPARKERVIAIIFGIKNFQQYLLGHHFIVHSEHQPLKYLFGETRAIPVPASSRIQRWAHTRSSYSYSVQHKPGRQLANADALSRLPLDPHSEAPAVEGDVRLLRDRLEWTVVTSKQIQQWTSSDPIMATVCKFT